MTVLLALALLAATPPPGMDAVPEEDPDEIPIDAVRAAPAVPWALTGTSSVAEVPLPSVTARVERRYLAKSDRLVLRSGFTYLARDDFRTNPGVAIEGSWYLSEAFAIDAISASVYFSRLTSTADALSAGRNRCFHFSCR